ncbi:TetR family transcriptional regulator [Cryobacterium psychrophilum]|uniref:TetR/AcrR family transcriptional regulator n=2 Tax=Cryobacterium psychrophilum TaxID=41988 RepID=A0A4Y8KN66_9MICO|nr:TetR family transcriptional regulator [Cryobacterium psychrophilum]TFD76569.1 TetR/AcrR family transcriptional regulator [Cryobacterium psychrophilum]
MPRPRLNTAMVVDHAAQMLDERGSAGFNLAALAESLDVRIPSLYKHIEGMPGLRRGIMIQAKASLAHALGQAAIGRSRDDAIERMSFAYRRWALEHPGQYPMTVHAPAPGDDEDLKVSSAIADVVYNVLAGYDLRDDDAVDATRFLRSALHGFVALETSGGFELPVDLERSFMRLVTSVVTALASWSGS